MGASSVIVMIWSLFLLWVSWICDCCLENEKGHWDFPSGLGVDSLRWCVLRE